jgi:hypothetical protein
MQEEVAAVPEVLALELVAMIIKTQAVDLAHLRF